MSFDQTTIKDVATSRRDAGVAVSWVSTAPDGTWFQVYVDRRLAWHGTARTCVLPSPGAPARIDVGAVSEAEAALDLSASLPTTPGGGGRINVAWQGGLFQSPDLAGFRVYTSSAPGGAVNYSKPAGTVAAYAGGVVTDGFGRGGFGSGGFGSAGGSYSWTSGLVRAGTWNVAVVPYDTAGNEGTPATGSAVVSGPPRPPARDAAGRRLTYAYNATTHVITLNWLASPGA